MTNRELAIQLIGLNLHELENQAKVRIVTRNEHGVVIKAQEAEVKTLYPFHGEIGIEISDIKKAELR